MLAALGLGLVQGFTKNIQEEKAIRASEQQSIDKLNDMLINASLTGGKNFSQANATVIANAIKTQQGKLDERERIDIFGTPGPRISTDLSSIVPLLQTVDEEAYTLGGVKWKTEWDGSPNSSRVWLSEVAGWANSPDFQEKMDALTPSQAGRLSASVNGARSAIIKDETDTTKGLMLPPDISGTGVLYKGINNIDGYMIDKYGTTVVDDEGQSHSTDPYIATLEDRIQTHMEQHPNVPFNSLGPTVRVVDADTGEESEQTLVLGGLEGMTAEMHNQIAQNLGYDDRALFYLWTKDFMQIAGIPADYKKRTLINSIDMGMSIDGIENLTPQQVPAMLDGGTAEKAFKRVAAQIKEIAGTDFTMAMYALAPHLPGKKDKPQPALYGRTPLPTESQTIQQYILTKVYGEDKADEADFQEFMKGQADLTSARERLEALHTEFESFRQQEEKGEIVEYSLAYQAFKAKLIATFDLDKGVLGNLLRDLNPVSEGKLDVNNKDTFTVEYRQYLEDRVNNADEKMAALEAMRISLAFEMARAADPSGRLSNQDIELQLRKLGADTQTIGQAQAAIMVSINEFKKKEQQYAVFARFASDDRVATQNDYKIVDAAIVVDFMNRNGNIAPPTGQAAGGSPTPPNISNVFRSGPVGGPYKYIDQSNGNTITDQATIDAYEAAQGI
jgi:hypothetical protein